ncbi:GHMP kinase [Pseudodesulfovibrio sp.]|nr:GHMP kinase [Pseudodesulfovibrio sp.]
MIITRTPFRVSLAGGGTDMREFYANNGHGMVLSTTIQKYMYIAIHPYFQDKIRIKYSKVEDVDHADEIRHPIVRECLRRLKIERGIEIASFADVSSGSGLGSSSSFTVGLLHALHAYRGEAVPKQQLAEEACEIEIEILGEPIGKQDQYAAACGGLNIIRFNEDESVEVKPVQCSHATRKDLESQLRLYHVGGRHQAGDILGEQQKNMKKDNGKFESMRKMMELVPDLEANIRDRNGAGVGDILHQGWIMKRDLADGISSPEIDELYNRAMDMGATGGKLLGAGGAGFLLLAHSDHDALKDSLQCRSLPLEMDREGTKLMMFE